MNHGRINRQRNEREQKTDDARTVHRFFLGDFLRAAKTGEFF
jgi:hypothetical protein